MPCVLHITPHLGGGVEKAVSELVAQTADASSQFMHVVATQEPLARNRVCGWHHTNGK